MQNTNSTIKLKNSEVRKLFCYFNEKFFDSQLPTCEIKIISNPYYLGLYNPPKNRRLPEILIAAKPTSIGLEDWTTELLTDVLLHEMIHFYVEEIIGRRILLFAHGYKFRKIQRMLKKKYNVTTFITFYHHKKPPSSFGGKIMRIITRCADNFLHLFF